MSETNSYYSWPSSGTGSHQLLVTYRVFPKNCALICFTSCYSVYTEVCGRAFCLLAVLLSVCLASQVLLMLKLEKQQRDLIYTELRFQNLVS